MAFNFNGVEIADVVFNGVTCDEVYMNGALVFTSAPPVDITPPVITLLGDASVVINQDEVYTDAGATALDDVDGDITDDIVVVNPVDTATPSVYSVTYNVSDAAGNPADEVTRSVEVVATSAARTAYLRPTLVTNDGGWTNLDLAIDGVDGDDNGTYAQAINAPDGSLVLYMFEDAPFPVATSELVVVYEITAGAVDDTITLSGSGLENDAIYEGFGPVVKTEFRTATTAVPANVNFTWEMVKYHNADYGVMFRLWDVYIEVVEQL